MIFYSLTFCICSEQFSFLQDPSSKRSQLPKVLGSIFSVVASEVPIVRGSFGKLLTGPFGLLGEKKSNRQINNRIRHQWH